MNNFVRDFVKIMSMMGYLNNKGETEMENEALNDWKNQQLMHVFRLHV